MLPRGRRYETGHDTLTPSDDEHDTQLRDQSGGYHEKRAVRSVSSIMAVLERIAPKT